MMRMGRIGRGAIDGVVHALLLVGMSEVLSSTWWAEWPTEVGLLLPLPLALLSAVVFALCVRGERKIWRLCLWSTLFCLMTWGLALVNAASWQVRLLPAREGSNGDGLLLLLAYMAYMACALGARGFVWAMEAMWRWTDEAA